MQYRVNKTRKLTMKIENKLMYLTDNSSTDCQSTGSGVPHFFQWPL